MRLFVSVSLTPQMKKHIYTCREKLKRKSEGGRFSSEENFHITLAFIGELEKPDTVKNALQNIEFSPFEISTGNYGFFGTVAFVEVDSHGSELRGLSDKVRTSLKDCSIPFDKKRFSPHITVGRDVRVKDLPSDITDTAKMTVTEFSLMSSEFTAGRRIYKKIFTVHAKI